MLSLLFTGSALGLYFVPTLTTRVMSYGLGALGEVCRGIAAIAPLVRISRKIEREAYLVELLPAVSPQYNGLNLYITF